MDFLFAIPSFLFHLVSSFFSLIWGIIVGIVGIVIWPFKLGWGLVMGAGKLIISILLAPLLLFYHPSAANVSAAQPVTGTIPAISNSSLEQIFNEIQQLELAGREMEPLRTKENAAQCGIRMREYQNKAENLEEKIKDLPPEYNSLNAAARGLELCVSCASFAKNSCKGVRVNLNDYQSMMSEE